MKVYNFPNGTYIYDIDLNYNKLVSSFKCQILPEGKTLAKFVKENKFPAGVIILVPKCKTVAITTGFDDAYVILPKAFGDERGYFSELNNDDDNEIMGIGEEWNQTNQSVSTGGTVRGAHFQKLDVQAKRVSAVRGSVLDFIVDIRKNSPTFKRVFAIILTPENRMQLYVPRGFAHGFVALEDNTAFQYFVSGKYNPGAEMGISIMDESLGIVTQNDEKQIQFFNHISISKDKLNMSEKDKNWRSFDETVNMLKGGL